MGQIERHRATWQQLVGVGDGRALVIARPRVEQSHQCAKGQSIGLAMSKFRQFKPMRRSPLRGVAEMLDKAWLRRREGQATRFPAPETDGFPASPNRIIGW
jgi:hypothetical protein